MMNGAKNCLQRGMEVRGNYVQCLIRVAIFIRLGGAKK